MVVLKFFEKNGACPICGEARAASQDNFEQFEDFSPTFLPYILLSRVFEKEKVDLHEF